jgi:hypothetical protein
MDIVNDFAPKDILLRGYENLDELVNDVFLDSIEMFPDGRDDFDNVKWGFKTREQTEKEQPKISSSLHNPHADLSF